MKHRCLLAFAFVFILLISMMFCPVQTSQAKSIEIMESAKPVLVVYYSKTGNTEKVAQDISSRLNADLDKIVDKKSWKGVFGFMSGGRYAMTRKLTQIENTLKNPADYKLVIVGTPIWAGNMTPAVRTYLNQYKGSFNRIAYFVTSGMTAPGKILKEVENIVNKKPVAYTGFVKNELQSAKKETYEDKISKFINLVLSETR